MDMPDANHKEQSGRVRALQEMQSLLAVQSVSAAGSTDHLERQMALLECLVASGSPLPVVVAMELHNLCEAAPLIQEAPGRARHWTLWYRSVWRPWLGRSSRPKNPLVSRSGGREVRAELACVALGSAMIARSGYCDSAAPSSVSEQLSEWKAQLEQGDVPVSQSPVWQVLNSFALEGVALNDLLGAGHAAMLLSDDPAWLPDPIFFSRALSRAPQGEVALESQAPSRRGASGSPDIVLADSGEFRDVGVARFPDNPSRLVPNELLWMGIDFDLFLQRAFSEGLLTRLGERGQRTARRPRVCFVLDLVLAVADWHHGDERSRSVSDLRSALHATACRIVECIDPQSADVEIWFGLEAPWCSANVGRARVFQKDLYGSLDDLATMLNDVILPTRRLWTDLPTILDQGEDSVEFRDFDEVVVMEFSTGGRPSRDLPQHARVHRVCLERDNQFKIDGVELNVGSSLQERGLCAVDARVAESASLCLVAGSERMRAELEQ